MRTVIALLPLAFLMACSEGPSDIKHSAATSVPTENLPDYFTCLDESGKALVAAHRGGPAPGYPENALETFQRMSDNGIFLLEVDVRTSKDGVLFLHHDEELDYSTTGKGMVADLNWEDLREVSLKDDNNEATPYRITRLDDALTWANGRAILQLDIKRGTDYDDVALAVRSAGAEGRVMPIAYTRNQALALRRKFPRSMISVPVPSSEELNILNQRGLDPEYILAWGGLDEIKPNLYSALESQKVEVAFGTLGGVDSFDNKIRMSRDESQYADIVAEGVDVISTDRPIEAKAALVDAGLWPGKDTCAF